MWDAFVHFLADNGWPVPREALERDVTAPIAASPDVQRLLIDVYKSNPSLVTLSRSSPVTVLRSSSVQN